jgi:hypothetical protein
MANFGYPVGYGGDEQTPNEDAAKHNFFKGYLVSFDGVEIYFRNHMAATPLSHTARFHSYEIYARDAAGNVSFWQGWLDFNSGNATGPYLQPTDACGSDGSRPIMMVNYPDCDFYGFESWYSLAGGTGPESSWVWDTGVNIEAPYYEAGDPADPSTWTTAPDGNHGLNRRVELAWYQSRAGNVPRDEFFWATQWGTPVSGPNDPVCGTQRTFGSKSYETKCLPQYIASTMSEVSFPGNASQKLYSCPNCVLPN